MNKKIIFGSVQFRVKYRTLNSNGKIKLIEVFKITHCEKMALAELSLNWAFQLKEADNFILGINNLSHLKKNLDITNKSIFKESFKPINKINLNNNSIVSTYL